MLLFPCPFGPMLHDTPLLEQMEELRRMFYPFYITTILQPSTDARGRAGNGEPARGGNRQGEGTGKGREPARGGNRQGEGTGKGREPARGGNRQGEGTGKGREPARGGNRQGEGTGKGREAGRGGERQGEGAGKGREPARGGNRQGEGTGKGKTAARAVSTFRLCLPTGNVETALAAVLSPVASPSVASPPYRVIR